MDKNAIKKYAVWARRELISRVSQKALQYGITEENIVPADTATVNGVILSNDEMKQRRALIERITDKGYQQVMEEVAYTWFNRFIALRFMEVNGYLPSHVRVFTDDENDFKPQIITEAIYLDLDGLDMSKVYSYKDSDQTEELYKYLLIVQCNALNKILPGMFQKISDYTELLLPDNLLRDGSVIEQMISNIPEDDFNVKTGNGQIEIIGWLYQYYISEKHEEVANLNKVSVKKEDIPAATQLFTTDWVVKYIVDNTVGRYWIERTPESSLAEELEYYIPVSNSEQDIFYDRVTPQDITVFDPCMGSGHFLVYAFEVLMKIYVEYGYTEREAAENIVLYNIYGLDIDERASQLAYFSIMMKACQYDRRFFKRKIQPNIFAMHDSTAIQEMSVEYFSKENKLLHQNLMLLIQKYRNAKEFGTMLYTPDIFWEAIRVRLNELDAEISLYKEITLNELVPVIQVADVMAKKYAIVITNPPYLNKYNKELKKFVVDNFKDYSSDLFSVFMYRNFDYCKKDGYVGFMTPNVWMFLQSYEKLRNKIEDEKSIISLIQFAKGAFFQEATVDICAFVLSNNSNYPKGDYFSLEEF